MRRVRINRVAVPRSALHARLPGGQAQRRHDDRCTLGTISVHHQNAIPLGTYAIQVINEICGAGSEIKYSPALTITNAKWGDTNEPVTLRRIADS